MAIKVNSGDTQRKEMYAANKNMRIKKKKNMRISTVKGKPNG